MALGSLRLKLGLLVAVVREPNRRKFELISARASARARACGPPAAHFCAARLITARVDLCRLSHDSFLPAAGVRQRLFPGVQLAFPAPALYFNRKVRCALATGARRHWTYPEV